ncbi:MAG: hypothetical protein AB2758_20675 [Candidatus Thiodiazotropha endolucinida]
MAKNEDIGTVGCPIKGCRETALLRKNARGWLYSACVVHGVIQSGVSGMQDWMKANAVYANDPDPPPVSDPEPEPEPQPDPEPELDPVKDDLDGWFD